MYDAVKLLALGLRELDQSKSIEIIKPIKCENKSAWTHGSSLMNYMRQISFQGVTGNVSFNRAGLRNDVVMSVMTITENGLSKIATWSEANGLKTTDAFFAHYVMLSMRNKDLVVTTVLNEPFCMLRDSADTKVGNDQFEGYGIDLVEELSKILQFKYTFRLVKDKAYGMKNGTEWNGMIGEVLRGEAGE